MLEGQIEKAVFTLARKQGWYVRKVAFPGRVGAPDRLFAKDGRIVFIELKATGKRVEEGSSQAREIARMNAAGVEAYWFDSIDAVRDCLGLAPA